MKGRSIGTSGLGVLAVVAIAFLALYNLTAYPVIWFDEGAHLLLPKNLARTGQYTGYAGPTIGVGPTVLLPIAAAFRLFGIGLLQARLVMVAYLFAAVFAYHRLARRLGDERFAAVATALFVSSQAVSLFYYGRQVLGEVPALAFVLAGLAVWFGAWRSESPGRLLLAGLLLGLGMVTKLQYALALAPAFAVAWLANLAYDRTARQRVFLLPAFVAAATVLTWAAVIVFALPSIPSRGTLDSARHLTSSAIFLFSADCMRRAIHELFRPRVFLGLVAPAFAYAIVCWFRRGEGERQWGVVSAIMLSNLVWFAFASIGWPRYAFLGLSLAALWVARLVADYTGRFGAEPSAVPPLLRRILLAWLALAIVVPAVRTFRDVLVPPYDAPAEMADYLNANVRKDALIETWEPEMGFLTDHRYHLPPQQLQADVLAHVWLGGPPVSEKYDGMSEEPDFVLLGDYGHLANVYPISDLSQEYENVKMIVHYQLWRRTAAR